MPKPKLLPTFDILDNLFDYNPTNGGIWKKDEEQLDFNVCGSVNRQTGYRQLYISGFGIALSHRVIWKLFYKQDPIHFNIDHKNCDQQDNRIDNLRKVKLGSNTQARNQRKKVRYVVDEDGVGRNVSCVSDEEYEERG